MFHLGDEVSSAKILIVEDNEADVFMLRCAFDDHCEAYELIVLADGEEAIRFIEEQRLSPETYEPCVILVDLRLPKYDGLEVLRAIKREPVLERIRVLLLSSVASPHEMAEVQALGGDFRIKPTELDEVYAFAAEVLAICKGFYAEKATASV
jgi:CheY-like chemotaxis protein